MSQQNNTDWIHNAINHIASVHVEDRDETEVIMVSVDVMKVLLDHIATIARGNAPLAGYQQLQYWTMTGLVEIKVNCSFPDNCIQGKTKDEYDADRFFDKLLSD